MDALDVAIIRAMDVRPYGEVPKHPDALNPARLARELGTTHVTVRARVQKMEDAGVIAGYQVYPNLRHLGLAATAVLARTPDPERKAGALDRVAGLPRLVEVHDFLGPEACIDVAYADEAELARSLARVAEETGDPSPLPLYARRMPPVTRTLSRLDWRILAALRGRAKRPLAEVADEIGVSAKTVRRHYDRMAEEGSFFAVPTLDLSRLEGIIPFFLNFHASGAATPVFAAPILRAFEDRRIHTYYPLDRRLGHVGLMTFARSVADMEALVAHAHDLPGVERVSAWVYRGWRERTEWLDAALADRLAVSRDESAA